MSNRDVVTSNYTLLFGDCLERMKEIPDGSVDLILTDLPYGTTACSWDNVIPFETMWGQLRRIVKSNKAIVLFAQEPFASKLRCSNFEMFKYDWFWRKSRPSGFTNAKLKPLKDIENICVFSEGKTANGSFNNMSYFPQGLEDCDIDWKRPDNYYGVDSKINHTRKNTKLERKITKKGYPRQVLDFANPNKSNFHPTQKPVDLLEYLIKTYTKENETVLDFTFGSCSTGVAALNTNRNFIGIEMEEKYFDIGASRMEGCLSEI